MGSEGAPGALRFLCELSGLENEQPGKTPKEKLDEAASLLCILLHTSDLHPNCAVCASPSLTASPPQSLSLQTPERVAFLNSHLLTEGETAKRR